VIIHFRDEPDCQRGRGKGAGPLGAEDRQSLEQYQNGGRSCRGWLPRGHEVHHSGTRPGRGSRGCWATIDGHIHGLLTRQDWGGRSGGASWVRSSRTFLGSGSVVVTAGAALGGRGRTTGWDWFIVHAPGTGGILTCVSRASMMKRTNGACRVVGGASVMGVSESPAVSALEGSIGRELKFDLALRREDEDRRGEG